MGDFGVTLRKRSSQAIHFLLTGFLLALLVGYSTSATAADPTTPGGIVLGSPGTGKVSNTGAGTYTLPIKVPPGTAGVAPNVTFIYDSQSGENGLLGLGWSLSGLPTIHRCAATYAQDGFRGGINYDSNDRFCLEGQRLIAISGTYGANGTEYRTEIDSGVKVVSYGVAGIGPAFFKLWNKTGQVMEFGNTDDSRIEAQAKSSVRVWALNKTQDSSGNYFAVTYNEDNANGDYRPIRIDYTGNTGLATNRSVQFLYGSRSDVVPMYQGGSVLKTMMRLTNLQTYVDSALVKDYRLAYENGTATGRSRLTSISECAADGTCMPATTFGWQEGNGTFAYNYVGALCWGNPSDMTWVTGDFNGDGKTDIGCHYWSNGATFIYGPSGFKVGTPRCSG